MGLPYRRPANHLHEGPQVVALQYSSDRYGRVPLGQVVELKLLAVNNARRELGDVDSLKLVVLVPLDIVVRVVQLVFTGPCSKARMGATRPTLCICTLYTKDHFWL